jgi:hypothetical protein
MPTKVNLLSRGILAHDVGSNCEWCHTEGESSSHLFFCCKMALGVRYEIFKWHGVVIVMLPNLFLLFECLSEAAKAKKSLKGSRLV